MEFRVIQTQGRRAQKVSFVMIMLDGGLNLVALEADEIKEINAIRH